MVTITPSLRETPYAPVSPATDFPVGFPIFGKNVGEFPATDIEVVVNDAKRTDFTVIATFNEGVSTDAIVRMNSGVTGDVIIRGKRKPRRTDQYMNGAALKIQDHNYSLNRLETEMQEVRRDVDRIEDQVENILPTVEALVDRAEQAANNAEADANSANQSKNAAEAAKEAAESAAGSNLANAETAHAVTLTNIPTPVNYVRTAGYSSPGDGGQALYRRVPIEPAHAGKIRSADGAWWEIAEREFDIRQFGAVIDSPSNQGGVINSALSTAAALNISDVHLRGNGEYLSTEQISIPENVALNGNWRTTIKRGNNFVGDFITLQKEGKLRRVIVDGNHANNLDPSPSPVLVRIGSSENVEVSDCHIFDGSNFLIVVNEGRRAKIEGNFLNACFGTPIAIFGNGTSPAWHKIRKNIIYDMGWSAILVQACEYGEITANEISAPAIGGRGNRLRVNTSGDTATWVSGPKFGSLRSGNFVVVDNGKEFRISEILSDTQVKVSDGPMPTLSNVPCSMGPGDSIGMIASSHWDISHNTIVGSSTFGIAISVGGLVNQCGNNRIIGNSFVDSGKNAINLAGGTGGLVVNNSIIANKILNPGNSAGTSVEDRCAIYIHSGGVGKVDTTFIAGNTLITDPGDGQAPNWLGVENANISYASVILGENLSRGFANPGILNDILGVQLSAGWGSTATVTDIVSNGRTVRLKVTASGSGLAADPSITMQKVCEGGDDIPLMNCVITTATDTGGLKFMYGEQQSVKGQWKAFYNGTPVAGVAYTITFKT